MARTNKGKVFEEYTAKREGGIMDGRKSRPDVVCTTKTGRTTIIECKWFSIVTDHLRTSTSDEYHVKGTYQTAYNAANGCPVSEGCNLREAIVDYCQGFRFLIVGAGDDPQNPEVYLKLNRKQAIEFLCARVCSQCSRNKDGSINHKIRFAFASDSTQAGGRARRLATLEKYGFDIAGL